MSKIIHVYKTSLEEILHYPPFNFQQFYIKQSKLNSGVRILEFQFSTFTFILKNVFFLSVSSSSHIFEIFFNPTLVVCTCLEYFLLFFFKSELSLQKDISNLLPSDGYYPKKF